MDQFGAQNNINELIELSNGSIGKIKDLIDNGSYEIYQEMISLMGPRKNETASIYAFCDRFSGEMEDVLLLKDFLLSYLTSLAKKTSNPSPFFDLWEEINAGFKDMDNLYLDKKNMFAHFFFKIGALS